MDEKEIAIFSLVGAVLGTLSLFMLVPMVEIPHVKLREVGNLPAGTAVSVEGVIEDVHHSDGHIFFSLDDGTATVKVVVWKDSADLWQLRRGESLVLEDGSILEMEAEIESYEGMIELVPILDRIVVRSSG